MTTLTIVADDLTGACDAGSLFAGAGAVPVSVWPDVTSNAPSRAVHVVDTESRRLTVDDAATRVARAARTGSAGRYFKKIDSTLRGRIGAELEALMTAAGATFAVVCPAFPAQRRLVVDGDLLVDGVPIAATGVHATSSVIHLLMGKELRVIHVTTHVALRRAPDLVTRDRVLRTIRLARQAMDQVGRPNARIAVAGLNPHAGEDGLFGDEEQTSIIPAIEAARAEGARVTGPLPADTLFSRARGGEFDIVVAMYHDQGHIPVKTLGFEYDEASRRWTGLSGVNVTVGLPFLRVSVDHGTAFDRAWKGIANHESMVEAIDVAVAMTAGR